MFDVLPLPSQYFLMENLAAPYFLLGSTSNKAATANTFFTERVPAAAESIIAPHRLH